MYLHGRNLKIHVIHSLQKVDVSALLLANNLLHAVRPSLATSKFFTFWMVAYWFDYRWKLSVHREIAIRGCLKASQSSKYKGRVLMSRASPTLSGCY